MITLASDFGAPYPAAMKGVLLARTDARLVDIGHEFPRQDVRAAGFWLREVLPWFPPAVHLVVVDPGVGTDRAAVAIRAGEHVLVAPDNGVAVPAARALEDSIDVFDIEYTDPESETFHGRDVFAPAAATVHESDRAPGDIEGIAATEEYADLRFPEPSVTEDGATGEVLVVDGFGTAITNVPGEWLAGRFGGAVAVDGERVPARQTYAAVAAGQRLVTVGSHGNVELAVNRGRGTEAFGVGPGDRVVLE
jgi:S-adenosylmethionine hydrolase